MDPVNNSPITDTLLGIILNSTWYHWAGGTAGYFYNPDNISISTYEKMVLTDETISSGLGFITLSSISRLGDYTHKDIQIQNFIREVIENLESSLNFYVSEIMTAKWAGFSVTENIWIQRDNKWIISDMQTLHPQSIEFVLHTEGKEKNKIDKVYQHRFTPYEAVLEPESKRIVYSYNKRFGNPYGNSALKCIYKNWYIKDVMLKIWGKTLQKYSGPLSTIKSPRLNSVVQYEGVTINYRDYLRKILAQIDEGSGIIVDPDTEIVFHQLQRAVGGDFETIINYCNKMMYRGLFIPSLLADVDNSGSYALGQKHYNIFELSTLGFLLDIKEVLLNQFVAPMIIYNFGTNIRDFGDFIIESSHEEDKQILANIFSTMTNAGYISPEDEDDLNKVRSRLGFSEKKGGLLLSSLQAGKESILLEKTERSLSGTEEKMIQSLLDKVQI